MNKKMRFFYYSDKSLDYQEVRFFKTKTLLSVVGLSGFLMLVLFIVNHAIGDPLGISRRSEYLTENRILKEQINQLSGKAADVQKSLAQLAEKNNELRVMVDLHKIDSETQKASTGGALTSPEFAFLSLDANALLTRTNEVLSKLEREAELQKNSYAEITKKYLDNKIMFMHLPAIKPCEGPYSLNGFGMRIHPVLGVWRMHEGLDINIIDGTPVYATGDATVRFSGRTQGGYGTVIELDHGYGYTTLYAHLSATLVRPGKVVKRGELIGRVGRSGLVSGPHLHYEVWRNGRKQNPVDYFFDDLDAARYRSQLAKAN